MPSPPRAGGQPTEQAPQVRARGLPGGGDTPSSLQSVPKRETASGSSGGASLAKPLDQVLDHGQFSGGPDPAELPGPGSTLTIPTGPAAAGKTAEAEPSEEPSAHGGEQLPPHTSGMAAGGGSSSCGGGQLGEKGHGRCGGGCCPDKLRCAIDVTCSGWRAQ